VLVLLHLDWAINNIAGTSWSFKVTEIFVFLFDFLIYQNEAMVKQMGVLGFLIHVASAMYWLQQQQMEELFQLIYTIWGPIWPKKGQMLKINVRCP